MKRIYLRNIKKYTFVDDEDYEWLSQYNWRGYKMKNEYTHYAITSIRVNGKRTTKRMHTAIKEKYWSDAKIIDHINHNGLNNQKDNLRPCTIQQNQANRRMQMGSSKFKGVHWYPRSAKWRSDIKADGRKKHIGYFDNEINAARAYDEMARKQYGEFAYTNEDAYGQYWI